jgi:capsular exopolysaccharide synthesis family protein
LQGETSPLRNSSSLGSSQIGPAAVFAILKRRFLILFISIVGCTVAAFFYTAQQPRIYEATATIDVDLTSPGAALNLSTVASGGGADQQKMATQLGIIQSQAIALDVLSALKLTNRPPFAAHASDLESLSAKEKTALIRRFQGGLSVQYQRGTEIAIIKYRSTDPHLAADVANGIADAYIHRKYQTRYDNSLEAGKILEVQLQRLQKEVADADQAFGNFQRETGLLQTDETHSSLIDRFNQLSSAISAAQIQRINKEIQYQESLRNEPDQVLPPDLLPTLQAARANLNTLQGEYVSLSSKYGESYPKMAQLKSQIAEAKATIASEIERGRSRLSLEFKASQQNEEALQHDTEAAKQQIFATNQNALKYVILQRDVQAKRALYEDLNTKLNEGQLTASLGGDQVAVLDRALTPDIPVSPRRLINISAGAFFGLFLGLGIVFLRESQDTVVRNINDAIELTGLPLLALVPKFSMGKGSKKSLSVPIFPAALSEQTSFQFGEAFRSLRSALLLSTPGSKPKVILISSAWPQEGKSVISAGLATILAQTGKRVLLIEADLRRPTLHEKLGTSKSDAGLSTILSSGSAARVAEYIQRFPELKTLEFLPSGPTPPSSSELLLSDEMGKLLEECRERYEFIVIDSPPILALSDSAVLAVRADATVLIARSAITKRQSLRRAAESLAAYNAKLVGIVVNDVSRESDSYTEYYGSLSSYGGYYGEQSKN